jgi:hypothetical protein
MPEHSSANSSYGGGYHSMSNLSPNVIPFMPGAENHHVAGSCYFVPMPATPVNVVPLGMGPVGQFPMPLMQCSGEVFGQCGFSNDSSMGDESSLQVSQGLPSKEDEGAKSLAARLAEKFPSARIIIGAPDAQEPPAAKEEKQPPDGLEAKMRRLRDLLTESKQGRVRRRT